MTKREEREKEREAGGKNDEKETQVEESGREFEVEGEEDVQSVERRESRRRNEWRSVDVKDNDKGVKRER
ncbi:Hypothetical predicted protein, partial [Xyrichtys novacula]